MHLSRTLYKFLRRDVNESLNTEKSSINTSMHFSTMLEKMEFIHLWKVIGALQSPKGILRYAKTPNGQVKVVFS